MSLQLLPGLIWALDEKTQSLIRRWYDGIPPKAQNVFQTVLSWQEFIDAINKYREKGFENTIKEAGLSLDTQLAGRRVAVVVVTSLPIVDGLPLSIVKQNLEDLGGQVILERHWVLVDQHPRMAGKPISKTGLEHAKIFDLRQVPWLLTREITGGITLDAEKFFTLLASLLDTLLFTEREGINIAGDVVAPFFQPTAQPGSVRLVGFSRISLDQVLERITNVLSRAVIGLVYHKPYDQATVIDMERQLANFIREFMAGGRTGSQIVDFLLGPHGFRNLSVSAILREGKRILDKEIHRVSFEQAVASKPINKKGLWCDIRQLIRKWLGKIQAPEHTCPDPTNLDYLTKNLKKMVEVISVLEEQSRQESQKYPDIPSLLTTKWTEELHRLVILALEQRWSGIDVSASLGTVIYKSVSDHFNEAIETWNLDDNDIRNFAKGLEEGNLLQFSAKLLGGLPTQVQCLVTTLKIGQTVKHGSHHISCATLRVWPGRPPVFLAATESIPLERVAV